jgi:hypothetical protein
MPFIPHKGMKRASPGGNNTRAHTRHARQVQDRAAFVPTSPGPGTGTGDFLSNYGVNQEAQAERAFRHAFDTLNIDDTPILEREAGGIPLPTPKGHAGLSTAPLVGRAAGATRAVHETNEDFDIAPPRC